MLLYEDREKKLQSHGHVSEKETNLPAKAEPTKLCL